MADITHGTIILTIPDLLTPPQEAGKLTSKQMQKIVKPPKGIGRVCIQAADAIDKAGARFSPPPGVTAGAILDAGMRADTIDQFVLDLDVLRERMRQAQLIFNAEAYLMARKMNRAIKAQMGFDAAVGLMFQKVLDAFAVFARATVNGDEEQTPDDEPVPPEEPPADSPEPVEQAE